jgi:hypothetical protein
MTPMPTNLVMRNHVAAYNIVFPAIGNTTFVINCPLSSLCWVFLMCATLMVGQQGSSLLSHLSPNLLALNSFHVMVYVSNSKRTSVLQICIFNRL